MRFAALALLTAFPAALPVRGVIFYATSDPSYNTTAPAGALIDSGWQWTGLWDGFQGAPIGPHHFLAARHIGGSIGDGFVFQGISYTTTAMFDDPASDLRIWQVDGTFPTWAPLYRNTDEVGRGLVVFGRGVTRGSEVRVNGNGALRGWMWASSDGSLRWGQNTVGEAVDGGSYWGTLLYATFDENGGANEADLGVGDSSAPIFVNDGSGWKLAGVAAAVDAYFNTTNSGNGFNAALFDARGLYYSATPPTNWQLIGGSSPVPTGFYATRVSSRTAWIDSIVPPTPVDSGDVPAMPVPVEAVLATALAVSAWRALRRPNSVPTRNS